MYRLEQATARDVFPRKSMEPGGGDQVRSIGNARSTSNGFSSALGGSDCAPLATESGDGSQTNPLGLGLSGPFEELLVKKVIEAQEVERRRIACDIHDETEQLLGGAIFRLDMCLMQWPEIADGAKRDLNKIRAILITTVQGLQDLSHGLRPSLLDDLGLEACLTWLFRTTGLKDRLNVRWSVTGLKGRLPGMLETALFRIIQEACNNVLKHSRAKNLHVGVRVNHRRAIAVISDDGIGFDAKAMASPRSWVEASSIRMGLGGMKERAELVGGRLVIRSRPRKGTRVAAVIPFPAPAKELAK